MSKFEWNSNNFFFLFTDDKSASVYTWGAASQGQLCVETSEKFVPIPQSISFFAKKKVISIGAGASHVACVVSKYSNDFLFFTFWLSLT